MRLAAILLVSACLLQAETATEKGKRIAQEAIGAIGGDKFLNMQDLTRVGRAYSFYREQLSGLAIAKIYTRYLSIPDPGQLGVRERQVFGKKEEDAVVFFPDGAGWEITFRGARPLPEDRVRRYRDSTLHDVFYILRERMREPGLIFEFQSSDVWNNMPVNIVEISDANNNVLTVYFHQSTKLPIRQMFFRRDPKTRERDEEVTVYSKYHDAGGILWPFDIRRERNGEKIFEMFAESAAINKGLPDHYFDLPPGAAKLKPVN
jgi:hypothetical protein